MTAALVERVRRRLVDDGVTRSPDAARVAAALRDEGVVLGDESLLHLVGSLRDELGGLGPLQSLVVDPHVTDVLARMKSGSIAAGGSSGPRWASVIRMR